MNHSWQFEKMQMYFDCDTNAICRYSEQINRLPEEERKAVYADIAGGLKAYVESLIQYPAELNRIVGKTVNEICRSMYLLGGYGWKEGQYLKNTAAEIFKALAEHRVFVHFGISGECRYPNAALILFKNIWRDCGFRQIDVYSAAVKVTGENLGDNDLLAEAYRQHRTKILDMIWDAVPKYHEAEKHYVLVIPGGKESDFFPMTDTVGDPGMINILKPYDWDSPRFKGYPFWPPEGVTAPPDKAGFKVPDIFYDALDGVII